MKSQTEEKRGELRTTLLVALGALVISLPALFPGGAFSFLLTLWIVREGVLQQQSWSALGFRLDNLWFELKRNALLIGMVGVVIQIAFWLVIRFLYAPLLVPAMARIVGIGKWFPSLPVLLVFIMLFVFWEEIAFRGFLQARLAPYWGTPCALLLAAFAHAAFHLGMYGNVIATVLDGLFMLLDSCMCGWIYARSGNLFVAWLAHLLADMVSIALMSWMFVSYLA